ncbi:MAG: ribosome small subunit-dependent GTPase A [Bdellovibrionales bacterium GWA2_49_15]|nr:MAG: ribosome small subunit-dependent GTPase A [Bdellovibrionales bacterium GWA2_49_15]HAZ12927.1 ribosome small subunit-dependent GTPase A [Bdellovibrionales bacterium]
MSIKARIIRSDKRVFDCRLEDSKKIVQATSMGNLLKGETSLVVGDYVEVEFDSDRNEYKIMSAHARRNEIFRIQVREHRKRVTASNCDLLIAVTSASLPEYKRGVLDRLLVRAAQWGVDAFVVFNKMDTYLDQFVINDEVERLKNINGTFFEVAALDPQYKPRFLPNGLDELKQKLQGKTAIVMGQSGVGKSRLISALSGGMVELPSLKISKVGKGSHTTTWSEIVSIGDFELIDSPGMRSISVEDIAPEDLIQYFPDLFAYASRCKFSNCKHSEKIPGCAFHPIFQAATSEAKRLLSRLESYQRIMEEVSSTPDWQKKW